MNFHRRTLLSLRAARFTELQILEAIAVTAFTLFLNTVQKGTGARPDFKPQRSFRRLNLKNPNLSSQDSRPTQAGETVDPDAELVAKAQAGDLAAFESLVDRYGKRVNRTLVGLLGSTEEARDAMQDTFLKAFQHLTSFQRRSQPG